MSIALKGKFSSSSVLPGSVGAELAKKNKANDDISDIMGGGSLTSSAGGLLTMDATVRKKKSIVFTSDSSKGKSLKDNNYRRSVAVTNVSSSSSSAAAAAAADKKKLKKRSSVSLGKGERGLKTAARVPNSTGEDENENDENLNFRSKNDERNSIDSEKCGRMLQLRSVRTLTKISYMAATAAAAETKEREQQIMDERQFSTRVNKVKSLIQKHHSLANYGFMGDNDLCSSYNFKTLKETPSYSGRRQTRSSSDGRNASNDDDDEDPLKNTIENVWQDYFARYEDDVRVFDAKLESCDKEIGEATDTLSHFVDRLDVFQSDDKSKEDRVLTNFLKKQNSDIEATLEQIDDVLDIFACPSKCDAKIREGPTGNAIDYFTTVDKLIEAKQFLEEHPNYVNSSETITQIVFYFYLFLFIIL